MVSLELNQGVGMTVCLPEALGKNLFPYLFHLLEARGFDVFQHQTGNHQSSPFYNASFRHWLSCLPQSLIRILVRRWGHTRVIRQNLHISTSSATWISPLLHIITYSEIQGLGCAHIWGNIILLISGYKSIFQNLYWKECNYVYCSFIFYFILF